MINERRGPENAIREYFEANRLALELGEDLPITILNTFLACAMWGADTKSKDPLTIKELALKIGLPYTTVSRHLRYLDYTKRGAVKDGTGLGLVTTEVSTFDRRQKMVFLTPKGKTFLDRLTFALGFRDANIEE